MNELKFEELQEVNGGGWKEAGNAFVGTVGLGLTPLAAVTIGPKGAGTIGARSWDLIQNASKNAYRKKKISLA
ncbi:hypothetical protein [Paraclostridium bifermentans]|uniref:hypothetical protein n=1 Tax=Paraclostridium bifermentans TaxID=1490 RepID=UPI0021C3E1AA|nr:hypothetical protein [Paraclostridium bifermentans]GKZ04734.1 hypothetical protein ANS014_31680 [Paraclostridium bifermentans]